MLLMVLCRIGERSSCYRLCQLLFLASMVLVALATCASLAVHSGTWIFTGVTVAAMAVGASVTSCGTAAEFDR
jgi:hypothetical protein